MSSELEGSCNCGKIELTLKDGFGGAKGILCHCNSCRRKSGGSLSSYLTSVPVSALSITRGLPRVYHETGGTLSGNTVHRHFCGDCGSPIYVAFKKYPGVVDVPSVLFGTDCGVRKEFFWENTHTWEKHVAAEGDVYEKMDL